jgi:hypothetical protein
MPTSGISFQEAGEVFFWNPNMKALIFDSSEQVAQLSIFDAQGKVVVNQKKIQEKMIRLEHLPSGIYVVLLERNGKKIERKIFI